jgi:hypothetical protein
VIRIVFVLLASLALAASAVGAADGPVAPDRQQLTKLLAGNSMRGIWAGRHYVQYFAADGSALYREQDGPVSEGRWRVDEDGRYCSRWPPAEDWQCYSAMVSGSNVYWKADGQYYPAEILPGKLF